MPIALKPRLAQKVSLNLPKEDDPQGDAYAVYRPASQRDVERIAKLSSTTSRIYRQGAAEMEVKGSPLAVEQQRLQVYLTLLECNFVMEDGVTPVFRSGSGVDGQPRLLMTEEEFLESWGLLPETWATALILGMLEVNPQWDPGFQRR